MKNEHKENCENCFYGRRISPDGERRYWFYCFRYPPTMNPKPCLPIPGEVTTTPPLMFFSGWCGEYKRKVEK